MEKPGIYYTQYDGKCPLIKTDRSDRCALAPIGRCRVPRTRWIVSALRAPPIQRVRADCDSQCLRKQACSATCESRGSTATVELNRFAEKNIAD